MSVKGERQLSTEDEFVDKQELVSKDEEELEKISFLEVLRLNKPDWPYVLVGVAASAFIGAIFPAMAPLFSEILQVRASEENTS